MHLRPEEVAPQLLRMGSAVASVVSMLAWSGVPMDMNDIPSTATTSSMARDRAGAPLAVLENLPVSRNLGNEVITNGRCAFALPNSQGTEITENSGPWLAGPTRTQTMNCGCGTSLADMLPHISGKGSP